MLLGGNLFVPASRATTGTRTDDDVVASLTGFIAWPWPFSRLCRMAEMGPLAVAMHVGQK
jgi:hypothetical protein